MITPDNPYFAQVRLLVGVLPMVARERCFALKGGTAINLFVRDMPRLSVDIDLAFVPIGERAKALTEIDTALNRITQALKARPHGHDVAGQAAGGPCLRIAGRRSRRGNQDRGVAGAARLGVPGSDEADSQTR